MNKFILKSEYKPTGDQPQAIEKLVEGINDGLRTQVLLGVTGSGKTLVYIEIIDEIVYNELSERVKKYDSNW